MMGSADGPGGGGWIAVVLLSTGLLAIVAWSVTGARQQGTESRRAATWVLLLAVLLVLGSGVWLVTHQPGAGRGAWWGAGGPMTGGAPDAARLADAGPVDDLDGARDRAQELADTLAPGLHVGEVMEFTENFYVELQEADGTSATEVLVDLETGRVHLEFGPAMMWNTDYGMHRAPAAGSALLGEAEAVSAAERWAASRDGLTVDDPVAFPGYYTLHTLRYGRIEGMVSVHATTGATWYHHWHGDFVAMSEHS